MVFPIINGQWIKEGAILRVYDLIIWAREYTIKKGVCLTNYEYDEHGNKVEIRNYGVDGQLKMDKTGIALYRISTMNMATL